MQEKREILRKRIRVINKHRKALSEYKQLIDELEHEYVQENKNLYTPECYERLSIQEKALFEAYLKRFSSLQDYMGAKLFPLIMEMAGIAAGKMSEILIAVEREQIIDSLQEWIELREFRNVLEHDYPEILEQAMEDLQQCVASYEKLALYAHNVNQFVEDKLYATL
jgi:hypothetical protein